MTAGVFDGVWPYGQKLYAYDGESTSGRVFSGFLEPVNLGSADLETRDRAGTVAEEMYRLIAAPKETFPYGTATVIVCGTVKYEVLSVKEVFDGAKVSHRECILLKAGEVKSGA